MKILVVEDSTDLAETMREVLAEAGHEVWTNAGDSLEGVLARVVEGAFDLLLVDLGLAGFDGVAIIDALCLARDRPAIVICTGRDEREVTHLRPKVEGLLRKPFKLEELAAIVASCASAPESGVHGPWGVSDERRRDSA